MTKRFIIKKEMLDVLDPETMRDYVSNILQHIEDCQGNHSLPNLESLGQDVLKTSFEFGLVDINSGCSGCSGGCPTTKEKTPVSNKSGKVIPFKKLH
ncbi:hypothetical protein [Desulforamulus aquiferis]|uniref:Uncharacterized protein n=1 Tax=Desulforamulus aquiferis TaxID=1397668 RepID=A0AAW7Z9J9_9FIRM|nr:hypothetical protein [Desulforamulus aquiferis]MDO7785981.1 hypothetical protein [Desulforamulus aquiferis]RYD01997.1 hypothetical protein N752_26455 [Desulforamulus aquiferis]